MTLYRAFNTMGKLLKQSKDINDIKLFCYNNDYNSKITSVLTHNKHKLVIMTCTKAIDKD